MEVLVENLINEIRTLEKRLDEINKKLYDNQEELELETWAKLYGEEFEISLKLLGASTDLKVALQGMKEEKDKLFVKRTNKEVDKILGKLHD